MIHLRTLGALELRDSQGQEVRALLAQPKRIALLAYLAVATPRGFHPRDKLLAIFWPEHDTEHARNSLNQSVHALRRALGADVIVSRNGDAVGLERGFIWCDAVAFEEALDAGRLADALELYHGDLLEGFHLSGAPEFDRWLEAERVRLAGRYAQAVETLAREREAAGDTAAAVAWWRRLAARDPYSSRTAVNLMRALASAGDPAGAVQHARVHEALLREELNVAPDPEVIEIVRHLETGLGLEGRRPPRRVRQPSPLHDAAPLRVDVAGPVAESAGVLAAPPVGSPRSRRRVPRRALLTGAAVAALIIAGATIRREMRAASSPPIRSLAVLPLENLSGDSTRQAFADGMHDALITELARYPDLSVISRTSVMRYKGKKKPLREIARELKVDGVIEGTLMWADGRVRMNAQLIHGPSDRHLWAKKYERDLRDVLVLQSELAEAIAREVRVANSPLLRTQRKTTGPADSIPEELYLKELYLRGRHAEISRTPSGLQTAKEAYQRAIERDSTFALGYAGLAGVYGFLADYDYAPARPALDSARMMARRAVALDSSVPEARTALAVTLAGDRQLEAAEREFLRAVELGPSNARAHYWYSILLVALGRGEEALREVHRVMELDPFPPRGVTGMLLYGQWLVTGVHPELQVPVAKNRAPVLKIEPREAYALAWDAVLFAEQGHCLEARSEIQRAQQLVPDDNMRMLSFVGPVYWWCGERGRARAVAERMKRLPQAYDHGARVAILHALFADKDSAFVWIRRNQWTLGEFSALSGDRRWDPLRSDPRFAEFLRELGLRKP